MGACFAPIYSNFGKKHLFTLIRICIWMKLLGGVDLLISLLFGLAQKQNF